ncbi:MAG: metal-dependent hydrolase [Bryobacteraceae bacterium]|nr:metal-dependent hydrolase [Bryobacteraceae bacterium]
MPTAAMFIGHFAVGFASKRAAPRVSLAWLLTAPLLLDLLWPVFLLLGWEHVRIQPGFTAFTPLDLYHMPWSHSLVMSLVWSGVFAGAYYARSRHAGGAVVLFGGVFSHWVLDWITHAPDMALWPGGPKVGLGLWNSIAGTLAVEFAMSIAAVWVYLRVTRGTGPRAALALWSLIALLVILYVGSAFGPPPPDERTTAFFALSALLTPFWGAWIERNRSSVGGAGR